MLQNGSPIWLLWLFGIITVPTGFAIWHGLGAKFGLGESNGSVDERVAYVSLALLVAMLLATTTLSARF